MTNSRRPSPSTPPAAALGINFTSGEGRGPGDVQTPALFTPRDPSLRWDDGVLS
jgi:hypothetical protein